MKLSYYAETDSLYIEFAPDVAKDTREVVRGVVVDFSAGGRVVGIDIDHASRIVDLTTLEAVDIPLRRSMLRAEGER